MFAEDRSLWESIKGFFEELFYGGHDMKFENFSFGNQIVTYRMIILAIGLGLVISSAVMIYKRRVEGRVVRELFRRGATCAENAKTLKELGLFGDWRIENSLRRGTLGRMLRSVEKDEYEESLREKILASEGSKKGKNGKRVLIEDRKPRPLSDRYYIPEDRAEEMVRLFSERGSGIWSFLLTVVLTAVAVALLFVLVPWFVGLIDSSL